MSTATECPDTIRELVERFDRNREAYVSAGYNETQARREFIDPFFEALGWDVANKRGYAEAYKDVIHEDAIKVGGATKAPDYCFRIGGTRKFFVEAKAPHKRLADDPKLAYQLRRYGWSAKLPLSILTDFEEFAVYDCRRRPKESDGAGTGRPMFVRFEDYPTRWREIADTFARESILKGSFDRYAESTKRKRGTSEVDQEFLSEIEGWRDLLARTIALRNTGLSQRELNFAVGRTIDRIIFLRMCEDRSIEDYGRLQGLLNGTDVYGRLCELFRHADDRYNSGLFHFRREKDRTEPPDDLTPALQIDDKALKTIIKGLYYPDSPYEFSVLPADILGQVYEQFLGKVIRLTAGHRAVVEDKPEVKKAGGVYYTPTYIVDYIVEHTVGKLLDGCTPREVAGIGRGRQPLRVLDPACGSGSFLIGAYQRLLDWHRDWYVENLVPLLTAGNAIGSPEVRRLLPQRARESAVLPVYEGKRGEWRLTTGERKRILLTSIYGVDIDAQAVEVTKLSLLLKVLEGESKETLDRQSRMWHERALPDLASNIKCGNSLIGPDFYRDRQSGLFDDEERYRINAFDWGREFPEILGSTSPGFDAVIGNPPYIRVRVFKGLYPDEASYLEGKYKCARHVWDIYMLFCEKATELLGSAGRSGFILPIQTLHQPNCLSVRKLLLERGSIVSIVDLSGMRVFDKAIVKNCIILFQKGEMRLERVHVQSPALPAELADGSGWEWPQTDIAMNPGVSLKVALLSPKRQLCMRLIERSHRLVDLCYATFGLRSCAKGVGRGTKGRLILADGRAPDAKPYLEGRDIGRYSMEPTGRFLAYRPSEMYSPRTPELFENEKIVSRSMLSSRRLVATIDRGGYYVEQSLVCVLPHGVLTAPADVPVPPLAAILAVLNSRLETFFFATYVIDFSLGGGLIHATPGAHDMLVIPRLEGDSAVRLSALAEEMVRLADAAQRARTEHDRVMLGRQIEATDGEIDELVYELYGLTGEEIAIVEEATSG